MENPEIAHSAELLHSMNLEHLNEIPDVMAALHCGRTTVFKLLLEGRLESIKIGRKRLITGKSVTNYIAALLTGVLPTTEDSGSSACETARVLPASQGPAEPAATTATDLLPGTAEGARHG